MSQLDTAALLPLLPALNFKRSLRFYLDLGFHCEWSDKATACFRQPGAAFLLHSDYMAVVAENTCMVLEVVDVDAWWRHVHDLRVADVYGVRVTPVAKAGTGREFMLADPSGVLWRIRSGASAP